MIYVNRKLNNKGRLESASIRTSYGYEVDVVWAKNGEATVVYGKQGKKHRRLVGLPPEGLEFGDSVGRQRNLFNGFILRRQSIVKKCEASLILDGKEMPTDQMVFDLNRSYKSRQEVTCEKLMALSQLLDLSKDEAKEVFAFAGRLKNARSGR